MTYAFKQEDRIRTVVELVDAAKNFAEKGWFPATSGNLSVKLSGEPLAFAVTASGKDKENLTVHDFLVVDADSKALEPTSLKPSAETLIHAEVYKRVPNAGACLHVHTQYNNLISDLMFERGRVRIQGLELIKALNIWEENAAIEIPIVENWADIPKLAAEIGDVLDPRVPAVLIRNHGITAWGENVFAAKRHLEAFEWMFHNLFLKLTLQGNALAAAAL
ncbi:methylthioribulose 1-phosphate dehydratase [Tumebacillus flagellatus]|uniref:Methylthioribulose-1-phosphate dehydratase n=1 Tax=Tumebacillus flagellatus TaxID=1157490 RepID=A0A074LQN3_9BACL|nr:methylthioribulose 1-phosphate dehydratase [Tumebacillus flagellatus]KEO82103.1 methylthioribulose-1-phosphate dehydratase [Tumebacillus flagellatus]